MKWKSLLKQLAVVGVHAAPIPGPVADTVGQILGDKATSNDEAFELMAQAMDAINKRLTKLEERAENEEL